MDYIRDVKESCDSIEEKVYEINSEIRDNELGDDVILELNAILTIIRNIRTEVNEENAYNVRNELMSIQKDVDALYDKIIKTK